MKRMILLSLLFFNAATGFAHEHREHGAHEHGSGTLAIAFDGLKGQAEFRAAAAGVLGFEHKARTANDKEKLKAIVEDFDKKISFWIQFEPSLKCILKTDKAEMVPEAHHDDEKEKHEHEGEHSDFLATTQITCEKSPLGTTVKFDFTSFSLLKDLDVTFLIGDLQKKAEAKAEKIEIVLKKD